MEECFIPFNDQNKYHYFINYSYNNTVDAWLCHASLLNSAWNEIEGHDRIAKQWYQWNQSHGKSKCYFPHVNKLSTAMLLTILSF